MNKTHSLKSPFTAVASWTRCKLLEQVRAVLRAGFHSRAYWRGRGVCQMEEREAQGSLPVGRGLMRTGSVGGALSPPGAASLGFLSCVTHPKSAALLHVV